MPRDRSGSGTGGLLGRLARDAAGNTLALIAAALIPLTAMIGSGIDMARAYTVQARLQQACDAAALAGRRVMTGNSVNSAVSAEVTKFFNFNYPQGMYNTATFTPQTSMPASGTLHITASTTMPTAVMQLFGYRNMPINTACDASQNFINADVVMVLDTTGSMDEKLSSGQKKIEALRTAVMSLYNQLKPTQDFLAANGYRLRYAVVPYSEAVNVGRLLYAQNTAAINLTNTARYFRVTGAVQNGDDYDISWATVGLTHPTDTTKWSSSCIEERKTVASASTTPTTAEIAAMNDLNIDLLPASGSPDTQWTIVDADPNYAKIGYTPACPTEAIRLKTFSQSDMQSYVNGLAPDGSTYLDIGMIWGARFISSGGVFSDSPTSYNGMHTNKYMIFLTDGEMAPMALLDGPYGTEVAQRRISSSTPAGTPIVKFFQTADNMSSDLTARHNARFDKLCQIVRNMGVSIWTIKLSDAAMDSHLSGCAQSGQSATVSTQDALIAQFAKIGQDISELRLSL